MSDITTDSTRALHAVPNPEPLAHLTGAPATVHAELVNVTGGDGITATELALAAGLGRSTIGKALTTLEQHGLAVRTPGGHDGARRTPDRWRAAPTSESITTDAGSDLDPVNADPINPASSTPESSADDSGDLTDETAPDSPASPIGGGTGTATASTTKAPKEASSPDTAGGKGDGSGEDDVHHKAAAESEEQAAPAPQAGAGQQAAPAEAINVPGQRKRLAPGALRQMITDHLQAYPGEAFTATRISRVIEKSSGAIANALDKLAEQGIAEQVSDRPRTFRLATPETDG